MKAIVAISENGGIGYQNKIPWHIPEDFKWFKEFTLANSNLLMGRKTYDSLPSPLKDRFIHVLSRNWEYSGGIFNILKDGSWNIQGATCHYVDTSKPNNLVVCGGSSIYKQFLPFCEELYITYIQGIYDTDTYFPFNQEEINSIFPNSELIKEITGGHKIIKYTR